MNDLLILSLIGGLFSLIGGFLLLINSDLTKELMTPLMAFGAGAFLGAAFLDILPEALEISNDNQITLISVLSGFVIFFIFERSIMKYLARHRNKLTHSDHTEPLPFLLILGDSIHNFLDGFVIALAYTANPLLGLPTALAVAAHEIPQEIGDFAILLNLKWKKNRIILVNITQSLLTIPGVFLGYFLGQKLLAVMPLLLGATAGIFLYIGASELVPELHHRSGHKHLFRVVLPLILSIIILYKLGEIAKG